MSESSDTDSIKYELFDWSTVAEALPSADEGPPSPDPDRMGTVVGQTKPWQKSSVIYLLMCVVILHLIFQLKDPQTIALMKATFFSIYKPRSSDYRLGDIFKGAHDAPACDRFPASIGCAYTQERGHTSDLGALLRVLDEFALMASPPNATVLHLRLGDGLCVEHDAQCRRQRDGVPDCWRHDTDCWIWGDRHYAFSSDWYASVARVLDRTRPIVIVANDEHWTRTHDTRGSDRSLGSM